VQDLKRIRIVLVQTSHPGNIGATARAMKNMGLTSLYLVDPKDYPSGVARGRAASALDILDNAVVVDSLDAAIADCGLVIGTSARSRGIPWPMVNPQECAEKLVQAGRQNDVALVFGREDNGLSNEELRRCHFHVQIPTNDEYTSLNVAAAVMVLCYEIRKVALHEPGSRGKDQADVSGSEEEFWDQPLATTAEMEGFLTHLEEVLTQIEVLDPKAPRQLMTRLRRLYTRIRPDRMEINLLRGTLTATQTKLAKKGGPEARKSGLSD
jgi:tRNA (cytidine32/uridine32-2'-O)-methyltransferase